MCARLFLVVVIVSWVAEAAVPADLSGYRPGPVTVVQQEDALHVRWQDETGADWNAVFSLDKKKPLIQSIGAAGAEVIT
ncbi:MAG: hypothetical protein GY953_08940, partial [bacterium]|nr:hypothetical protein [bacterium]